MRATVCETVGPDCPSRSAMRARSGTTPSSSSSKTVRRYISVVSMRSLTPTILAYGGNLPPVQRHRRSPAGLMSGGRPVSAAAGRGSCCVMTAADFVPPGADLAGLRKAAQDCRGCELWEPATQTVFSAGPRNARIVLVGEQPGDQEDRQGKPFVGPAGQLLVKAVDEAGLPRDGVYRTNAVKHFRFQQAGPGKRRIHQTPEVRHMTACRPWLVEELRIVDPQIIVCLGAIASKTLLGPSIRVTKDRGVVLERETSLGSRQFLVTVHPSAVLRAPDGERDKAYAALVADLKVAADTLR
jgi:uracil-DNA glycosylase